MSTKSFYPNLGTIVSLEDFPEELQFLENGLQTALDKIYYKELQYVKSNDGSQGYYNIVLVTGEALKLDLNGVNYYEYELIVAGLNSLGNYHEVNTGITIYTLDHLIFSSKDFAEKYKIDYDEAEAALVEFIKETLGIKINPSDASEVAGSGNGVDFSRIHNSTPEEQKQLKKGNLWNIASGGITKTNKQLLDLEPTPPSSSENSFKKIILSLKNSLDSTSVITESENKLPSFPNVDYEHTLTLVETQLKKRVKQLVKSSFSEFRNLEKPPETLHPLVQERNKKLLFHSARTWLRKQAGNLFMSVVGVNLITKTITNKAMDTLITELSDYGLLKEDIKNKKT